MVGAEGPENVWNFNSSRLAESALLFFKFKEGLFTLPLDSERRVFASKTHVVLQQP